MVKYVKSAIIKRPTAAQREIRRRHDEANMRERENMRRWEELGRESERRRAAYEEARRLREEQLAADERYDMRQRDRESGWRRDFARQDIIDDVLSSGVFRRRNQTPRVVVDQVSRFVGQPDWVRNRSRHFKEYDWIDRLTM